MPTNTYCTGMPNQGVTCLRENLVLLRRLSEDDGPTYQNIVTLYQCQVCQGLYKCIYSSGYQTRNFDAEEGWTVYSDAYFKVGERNGAGVVQFPLQEARIYGYKEDAA